MQAAGLPKWIATEISWILFWVQDQTGTDNTADWMLGLEPADVSDWLHRHFNAASPVLPAERGTGAGVTQRAPQDPAVTLCWKCPAAETAGETEILFSQV